MPVSAPEGRYEVAAAPGVGLGSCLADVVGLAALRGRTHDLQGIASSRGLSLPAPGRIAVAGDALVLCVRPARWLLLGSRAFPGAATSLWQDLCAGTGAAVDLSSGLTALHLTGPDAREALARGCRLDLDPEVFPAGHAAATLMAQVAVILAAVPCGMLILTPATTAQHFREWLAAAARPFGLARRADVTVSDLSGDQYS
jgi:heterotetrameric sarcosine oxidase gamma subunit